MKDSHKVIGLVLSIVSLTIATGVILGAGIKCLEGHDAEIACIQAHEMLCVQVHACTKSSVVDCDTRVGELQVCKSAELPHIDIIQRCTQQLRHIECEDDLPASCMLLME
jgi:hypothetical protein